MGPALELNKSLVSLDLGYNGISSVGGQVIGASLQVNKGLQDLGFRGNPVGSMGGRALVRAAENSGGRLQVDLFECDMTLEVA